MLKHTLPLLLVLLVSNAFSSQAQVLSPRDFKHYIDKFNEDDEGLYFNDVPGTKMISNGKAWGFLEKNIPFFECPDKEIERVYYFRWWSFRKHIKRTESGHVVTEFLPKVGWAGKYNMIVCPAGHHFREGRWLRDPKIMRDNMIFWLRDPEAPAHRYSFWAADSLLQLNAVHPDDDFLISLLPDLIRNYRKWEQEKRQPDGLFAQTANSDGMEIALGGDGKRPTINTYMYSDAKGIAEIARLANERETAESFEKDAERIRNLVLEKLWDDDAKFFKVLNGNPERLVDAREQLGYVPWYHKLPPKEKGYEIAWRQLMDPKGFYAPFGPTTVEQRHPRFTVQYVGHDCQWNGPSWPFATAQTLTALANVLHEYPQDHVTKKDYFETLKIYAKCHRFRQIPPKQETVPAIRDSSDGVVKRHTWWSEKNLGTKQWVQYDFPEAVELDAMEFYWYVDNAGCALPKDYSVLYKNGDEWKPVQNRGQSPIERDKFNRVEFEAISSKSFRLEVQAASGKSAGLLEWKALTGEKNLAGRAKPTASYTDVYSGTTDALNDEQRAPVLLPTLETQRCWIDENLNPYTGDWMARTIHRLNALRQGQDPQKTWERGIDYNHSTFCDLIISGLVGIRFDHEGRIVVDPLLPENTWDWFCLDRVPCRGMNLTILWDKTGNKYGKGKGLRVYDGDKLLGGTETLSPIILSSVPPDIPPSSSLPSNSTTRAGLP